MRKIWLSMLLFLFTLPLFGVVDTISGGAFQDPSGTVIANGSISFQLSSACAIGTTGQVVPRSTITYALDGSGNIATGSTLWGNDQCTPSGTFYTVTIYDASGQLVRGPENWVLQGASPISLGTIVAASGSVSYSGTVDLTSNQSIAGAKTFTTSLALTNAGVFTNTQQNEYLQSLINGCSPSTEYNTVNGSQFATDALTGCVTVSNGATANGANGIAGYANNASLATTPNAVGVYGQGRATGLNANVWGGDFIAADSAGVASLQLTGIQANLNVQNAASAGNGLAIAGSWTAQPTNANAIIISKPTGTGSWTQGINIQQGATTTTTANQSALLFNPVASGTNQSSQGIEMLSNAPTSGQNGVSITENPTGYLVVGNSAAGSGIIVKQTTGLFTTGQTNDTNEFWTNGIDPTAQVKLDFTSTSFMGNGLSTGIAIPVSPGNFQYNGLGSWVTNAAGAGTAGVALFGTARATAANSRVWGFNTITADVAGTASNNMFGGEIDLNVNNTTSLNVTGLLITGGSTAQPTSGTRALNVAQLGSGIHWHYGLKFEQAATVTPDANNAAIYFGPIAAGVNQISQGMTFLDNDTTSGQNTATVWETAAGNLLFSFSKAGTGIQGNAFQLSFQRSGGAFGFPDIVGTGAARVIIGDANGVGFTGHLDTAETTAPAAAASEDRCFGDSTAHALKCSYNNGTYFIVPQVIASGTASMTTALIATVACGTTVTVATTGVLTTDTIDFVPNAAVTAANNGLLRLSAWPTAGNVNFNYCNPTAAGVTPTATTVNFRVIR